MANYKVMEFSEFQFIAPRLDRSPGGERSRLSRKFRSGSIVRLQPSVYMDTDQWLNLSFSDRRKSCIGAMVLLGKGPVFVGLSALTLYGVPLVQSKSPLSNLVNVGVTSPSSVRKRRPTHCYGNQPDALSRLQQLKGQATTRRLPLPPPIRGQLMGNVPPLTLTSGSGEFRLQVEPIDDALMRSSHELTFEDRVVVFEYLLRCGVDFGIEWNHQQFESIASTISVDHRREKFRVAAKFSRIESESVGESLSRALLFKLGFEEPALQQTIQLPNGRTARPDYFWKNARIVGEFDGAQKYTRAKSVSGKDAGQVLYEEKLREDAIRSTGLGMCRWGWNDLLNPHEFARILTSAGVPRTFPRGRLL